MMKNLYWIKGAGDKLITKDRILVDGKPTTIDEVPAPKRSKGAAQELCRKGEIVVKVALVEVS